jgi:hypothetical protein
MAVSTRNAAPTRHPADSARRANRAVKYGAPWALSCFWVGPVPLCIAAGPVIVLCIRQWASVACPGRHSLPAPAAPRKRTSPHWWC